MFNIRNTVFNIKTPLLQEHFLLGDIFSIWKNVTKKTKAYFILLWPQLAQFIASWIAHDQCIKMYWVHGFALLSCCWKNILSSSTRAIVFPSRKVDINSGVLTSCWGGSLWGVSCHSGRNVWAGIVSISPKQCKSGVTDVCGQTVQIRQDRCLCAHVTFHSKCVGSGNSVLHCKLIPTVCLED